VERVPSTNTTGGWIITIVGQHMQAKRRMHIDYRDVNEIQINIDIDLYNIRLSSSAEGSSISADVCLNCRPTLGYRVDHIFFVNLFKMY
jgi:hypothetical protein